jgi:chorismate dehydratase
VQPAASAAPATHAVRVGVVSFINTLPLIDGLARLKGVQLVPQVPSRLADLLATGEVDLALCSSVDYQASRVPLAIVPVGMLGCTGTTHTVRLYARCPLSEVRTLAADTDSHTSRALAQLVLRRAGATAKLLDYDRRTDPRHPSADALLLIGDKVVNDAPDAGEWPHEFDLGEAWQAWTGLPFVFAVWMTRAELAADVADRVRTVARVLDHQRRHNRERLGLIAAREAPGHRWPVDLAHRYLSRLLSFDFDASAQAGLQRFYDECHRAGLLGQVQPIRTFEW